MTRDPKWIRRKNHRPWNVRGSTVELTVDEIPDASEKKSGWCSKRDGVGEKIVIAYNQVFDLPYTIVRPSALYGERCVSRRVGQVFIENAIKGLGITVNGASVARVPNTASITFRYADAEGIVIGLDLNGVAASTGAACSSGRVEPSHVLLAMGLSADEARSTVRFSLSRFTTEQEIEQTVRGSWWKSGAL